MFFADGMILYLKDAKKFIFKNLLELRKEFNNAASLHKIKWIYKKNQLCFYALGMTNTQIKLSKQINLQ